MRRSFGEPDSTFAAASNTSTTSLLTWSSDQPVVGEGGLEPPRPYGHWHLKPARLPIPPLARVEQTTLALALGVAPARTGAADSLPAMGIRGFERRLERLVEGAFARAFKSGLRPVELGRRLVREMDDNRSVGVRGGTVVPNAFTVALSASDLEQFEGVQDSLEPGARRRRPRARPRRGLRLHGPGRGRAGGRRAPPHRRLPDHRPAWSRATAGPAPGRSCCPTATASPSPSR